MNKIKITANAKVNFTLDITGVKNGYHEIESLVASVDLSDAVTLFKRNDGLITVKMKGLGRNIPEKSNNALIAGELFVKTFGTLGADIVIDKRIPLGGGLGGSSADAVAVLKGLAALYGISADLTPLANKLGSDTAYMLNGGFAVISGRGEKITPLSVNAKFYLLILSASEQILAKSAYGEYDKQGLLYEKTTKPAVTYLTNGENDKFLNCLGNHLTGAAKWLLPETGENLKTLLKFSAANMTGSGSAVYAAFVCRRERDKAYRKLKKTFAGKLLKAETI